MTYSLKRRNKEEPLTSAWHKRDTECRALARTTGKIQGIIREIEDELGHVRREG
jgi:hypothetical protein